MDVRCRWGRRAEQARLYGMLCCFSFDPDPTVGERHLKRLEMSARLAARLLDEAAGNAPPAVPPT